MSKDDYFVLAYRVLAYLYNCVTCSRRLKRRGFLLNSPSGLSINRLSPCAPRFYGKSRYLRNSGVSDVYCGIFIPQYRLSARWTNPYAVR